MAGAGLDARIMGKMSPVLKKWLGRSGIFFTAMAEFLKYEFPRLNVEIDGESHAATFAVVCKSRHYAGDWIAAPDASPESDSFDTVLFESRTKKDLFRLFSGMKEGAGSHLTGGFARVVRGRRVTVSTSERAPIEVQLDGDRVLETPFTCTVSETTVNVLVPPGKSR
jgi:diacylglycerol kinase family enzyme